jgi:hypothetical protein
LLAQGLELGVHVDPALDTAVVGDPDRLRQARIATRFRIAS